MLIFSILLKSTNLIYITKSPDTANIEGPVKLSTTGANSLSNDLIISCLHLFGNRCIFYTYFYSITKGVI